MTASQYRLVTRSDFDGLVCGVLLKELNLIDEIAFVHPKDMQDGKIPISARDITTNLPYVPGCHLAFDHHSSELVFGDALHLGVHHPRGNRIHEHAVRRERFSATSRTYSHGPEPSGSVARYRRVRASSNTG